MTPQRLGVGHDATYTNLRWPKMDIKLCSCVEEPKINFHWSPSSLSMAASGPEGVSSHTLRLYSSLKFTPPLGQFTILASFVLSSSDKQNAKVISLATGSKCLPATRLSEQGDALHDSHAEVLARRAAIRWFLEEITRAAQRGTSQWICADGNGQYRLKDDVRVSMYISTPPCAIELFYGYGALCSRSI